MKVRRKQTESSWPPCIWTDVKAGNYQAVAGDLVLADFASAPLTITAPAAPQDNQIFGVRTVKDFATDTITVAAGDAAGIETPLLPIALASVDLYQENATVFWQYAASQGVWAIITGARLGNYVELWTPDVQNIEGSGLNLNFTFVPLWPGQVSRMFNYAAGIFTHQFDNLPVQITLNLEIGHDFQGNNQFSDVLVQLQSTGTGTHIMPRIAQGYPTSRSVQNFWSSHTEGVSEAEALPSTIRFESTSAISGVGSSVDIESGLLAFEI